MNISKRNKRLALGAGALWVARALYRKLTAYSFKDKVVLIAGSSRGLGLVLARQLAREGARIALCARDETSLARARDQVSQFTPEVSVFPCDITDQDQVKEMVAAVTDRYGRIDVLINNAGIIQVGPGELMTREDYEDSLNVHFWGPWYTMAAVLPEMKSRKEGRIVNISSIGGKISVPHLTPYCAGKFALAGLSEGLQATYQKYNVYITSVYPGLMRTGSHHNIDLKGKSRQEFTWFSLAASLPLLTLHAENAAKQIVNACRHGDAELTISPQARLLRMLHGLVPGLTLTLTAIADRLMPQPDGEGQETVKGYESYSEISPSFWTRLGDKAALENNEIET